MTNKVIGDAEIARSHGVNPPNPFTAVAEMEESTPSKKSPTTGGRPILTSQQSNSLPSTPYQGPRNRSNDSRSPSLGRSTLNASPRSSHSESNHSLPALRKHTGGCKYETGMAKARRRVPYSLGPEKLEPESHSPKAHLSPAEDEKLSGDMRELYDRLLPSPESEERRKHFVKKLEKLLTEKWPGHSIQVNVFGSTGNNLGTTDSDVDICITTDCKELEHVCSLAQLLATHGMERVVCVSSAKVPIVKIWDPQLQLACDMNVNNPIALENTELIRGYVTLDQRVRPLAMIIKHWARRRILNDAALGGTLSSYTWICMIINFLQTRDPPILPTLQQQCGLKPKMLGGVNVSFDKNLESYAGFGSQNTDSLGELLFQFYRYYGHELDFEENVLSVRLGKILPKMQKGWHRLQDNRLCVEEPFNTTRNLANTADDTSMRGIHLELRRACGLVANGRLEECCEQYIPPQDEGKPSEIFVPPISRAVLTQAPAQPTKGPKNSNRGGRNPNHLNRSHNAGRHPSNPSARVSPYLRNLPFQMTPQELQLQQQHQQHLLHDRLFQQYQYLQAQEQELRMQLHLQALQQGRTPSTASYPHIAFPYTQQDDSYDDEIASRTSSISRASLSAPIHQQRFPYASPYLSTILPAQGVSNPPSPHFNSAVPATSRYTRRSSVAQSSTAGSLRAHSQPARSLAATTLFGQPPYQTLETSELDNIEQGRRSSTTSLSAQDNSADFVSHGSNTKSTMYEAPRRPAEYIGYYVGHSLPLPAYSRSAGISPIPSHVGLAIQNGGLSPRGFSQDPRYSSLLERGRKQKSSSDAEKNESELQQASLKSGLGSTTISGEVVQSEKGRANDGDVPNQGEVMTFSASTSEDLTFDTPTSSDGHSQHGVERVVTDSDAQFGFIEPETHSLSLEYLGANGGTTYSHETRKERSGDPDLDPENRATLSPRTPATSTRLKVNDVRGNLFLDSGARDLNVASLRLGDQLSPVKEVRTPSPSHDTTVHISDAIIVKGGSNQAAAKVRPDKSKLSNTQNLKDEGIELSSKPNGHISKLSTPGLINGSIQSSSWQTQKKKKRAKKAVKSETDIDVIDISGDSIPLVESMRKGG